MGLDISSKACGMQGSLCLWHEKGAASDFPRFPSRVSTIHNPYQENQFIQMNSLLHEEMVVQQCCRIACAQSNGVAAF
jgi:hypothetical protein